ncbi:MAG: hypothetical protein O3C63_03895 [Cyanobacteria bacterium]|nr:hypothetical protein [Cyanobacteriota bacterium]
MIKLQSRTFHDDGSYPNRTAFQEVQEIGAALAKPGSLAKEVQTLLASPADQATATAELFQGMIAKLKAREVTSNKQLVSVLVSTVKSPGFLNAFYNQRLAIDTNVNRALSGEFSMGCVGGERSGMQEKIKVFKSASSGALKSQDLTEIDPRLTIEELNRYSPKKNEVVLDDPSQDSTESSAKYGYRRFKTQKEETLNPSLRIIGSIDTRDFVYDTADIAELEKLLHGGKGESKKLGVSGGASTEYSFAIKDFPQIMRFYSPEIKDANIVLAIDIKTDRIQLLGIARTIKI